MAAANERFGASGAVTRLKVCADLQVLRPCERQWKPRLRQAAATLCESRKYSEKTVGRREMNNWLKFQKNGWPKIDE
jgi:hypothetical protein